MNRHVDKKHPAFEKEITAKRKGEGYSKEHFKQVSLANFFSSEKATILVTGEKLKKALCQWLWKMAFHSFLFLAMISSLKAGFY